MIKIINPSKLTRQPFFQALVNYLDQQDSVILRDIKREFAAVPRLDRAMEAYIQAGYILREDKRYRASLPLLTSIRGLELDQEVFIRDDSSLYKELLDLRFETRLTNETNAAVLLEETDFLRERLTLSNYFYRLARQEPLSAEQEVLYDILGDVNPQYALKYLTNFLLKYLRREELMQKRRDIFVDSLTVLGYIAPSSEGKYRLLADFDRDSLCFRL